MTEQTQDNKPNKPAASRAKAPVDPLRAVVEAWLAGNREQATDAMLNELQILGVKNVEQLIETPPAHLAKGIRAALKADALSLIAVAVDTQND